MKWLTYTGLGLLALGLLTFGLSFVLPMETSPAWYAQVLGLAVVGSVLSFVPFIKRMNLLSASLSTPTPADTHSVTDMQAEDVKCFDYLTKRFNSVNDTEAILLLKKLHGENLFALHYGKPKEAGVK